MRRFAIFATVLVLVVIVGSLPWNGRASAKDSWCVCLPSRAALMVRSLTSTASITKTATPAKQSSASAAAPSLKTAL